MEVNPAFEADRPGQPDPLRNEKVASALFHQGGNRLGKGLAVKGYSVSHSAVICDRLRPVGNDGKSYPLHPERGSGAELGEGGIIDRPFERN